MEQSLLFPTIIVVGLLILGAWFYVEVINNPREEKAKSKWIDEHKDALELQNHLVQILNGVGDQLPPCKKCSAVHFQLWEVINDEVTIRCTTCKKKYKHNFNLTTSDGNPVNFSEILNGYTNLIHVAFNEQNTKLGEYLRNYFVWDFFNLRKGTLLIRAITFNVNPDISLENDYSNVKSDEPSRRIPQKVMDKVWNRDGGKCVMCGSNQKLEFDHIIPFSKGGSNTYRNIQLLCEECNRKKSNNIG